MNVFLNESFLLQQTSAEAMPPGGMPSTEPTGQFAELLQGKWAGLGESPQPTGQTSSAPGSADVRATAVRAFIEGSLTEMSRLLDLAGGEGVIIPAQQEKAAPTRDISEIPAGTAIAVPQSSEAHEEQQLETGESLPAQNAKEQLDEVPMEAMTGAPLMLAAVVNALGYTAVMAQSSEVRGGGCTTGYFYSRDPMG